MNLVRGWNRFWFAPVSARPLGAFRIVYGGLALFYLFVLTSGLDYWLTDRGFLQGSEAREMAGPLRLSILLWVQDPTSVRVFVAATAVLAFLLMIGWRTRVVSVLFYLFLLMIHHRNLCSVYGGDVLMLLMAFYLMLSPSGAAYSIDAVREARKRGTFAEPIIAPWGLRLMQIQISVVYLVSALMKAGGKTWQNGTALHYVLLNPELSRFFVSLHEYPLVINILTYIALLVEFALAFLLWVRAARPWVMIMGVMLHLGILFTINVPIFGELTTACYLTFLSSCELDVLLKWVNPMGWFSRRRSPAGGLEEGSRPVRVDRPLAV